MFTAIEVKINYTHDDGEVYNLELEFYPERPSNSYLEPDEPADIEIKGVTLNGETLQGDQIPFDEEDLYYDDYFMRKLDELDDEGEPEYSEPDEPDFLPTRKNELYYGYQK